MKTARLLLVDDQVLFRKAIASLLNANPNVEVVGEAENGREAVEKARELKPDLVLMDIRMPEMDGIQATRLIKAKMPEVRIVILTVSDEEEDLFEAIKSGAQGYLLKNLRPEVLFEFLEGVLRGEAAISPVLASKILDEFVKQFKKPRQVFQPDVELTEREKEVLRLVVRGASNKDIANALYISEGTVKNHLHNTLKKLHIRNRAQATAYALREGIVKDTPEGYIP